MRTSEAAAEFGIEKHGGTTRSSGRCNHLVLFEGCWEGTLPHLLVILHVASFCTPATTAMHAEMHSRLVAPDNGSQPG